jgi:uncharacterized membrane protein
MCVNLGEFAGVFLWIYVNFLVIFLNLYESKQFYFNILYCSKQVIYVNLCEFIVLVWNCVNEYEIIPQYEYYIFYSSSDLDGMGRSP